MRFRPRQYLDENKFESYHLNMDETMIMNPTNHVSRQYHGRSHGRSTVPQNTRHVGMPQITMITFGIYQGDKGKSYTFFQGKWISVLKKIGSQRRELKASYRRVTH